MLLKWGTHTQQKKRKCEKEELLHGNKIWDTHKRKKKKTVCFVLQPKWAFFFFFFAKRKHTRSWVAWMSTQKLSSPYHTLARDICNASQTTTDDGRHTGEQDKTRRWRHQPWARLQYIFRYFHLSLLFIQLALSAGFCGQFHLCKLHVVFYIGQGCEHTYFKVYLLQTCPTQLREANVNMDATLLPYLGTHLLLCVQHCPFCLGTSSSSMDAPRNWSRSNLKCTLACAVEPKKESLQDIDW